MSHRVHPKIFRTKETADWNSRWLSKKDFSQFLEEDFRIREFLKERLKQMSLEKIEIERSPGKLTIIMTSARPGLIIGRGGSGIEELKRNLEKELRPKKILVDRKRRKNDKPPEMRLEIKEIKDPWVHAQLVSQWMAQQIERRFPYRRVLKQALGRIMYSKQVQGARVEIAGRLGGAEYARKAWLKKGRLPRQTIRADIDYASSEAYCSYGVVGVKVWIYKGEKFSS
ncbi:30S ribosomal protein S3 [Patescibacteria group bacterium]|nr:30S ribosomal protein S3 [Patescibacteria group bacterium]